MTRCARVALGLLVGIAAVAPIGSVAAETPPGEVSWVSAGDSYSSGEGVSGNQGDCAQSDLAYGPAAADLARAAGWQIGTEAFTACTGHLAEDLFNQRPGNRNAALWDWGLEQGAPDRVDLLTFSFGGNDIGFADLLIDCLPLPDSFTNAVAGVISGDRYDLSGCDTPEEEIEDRISALTDPPRRGCSGGRHPDRRIAGDPGYDCDLLIDDRGNADPGDDLRGSLVDFYVHLANEHLTDTGHIVVVGYPNLFAPTDEWPRWSPIACQGVTRGDTERIGRLAALLDGAIISAVRRANDSLGRERVHFVPRSIVYRNGSHELCGRGQDWLNGISVSRGDGTFHTDTSFHPNAAGHAATADALMNTLGPVRFEPPRADLANITLPGDACNWVTQYGDIGAPSPLRLVNGSVPLSSEFGATIQLDDRHRPFFADVDGDGAEEGIVVITCNAGGSGVTWEVHVYTAAGDYLDGFEVGDGVEGRPGLQDLQVANGTITIRTSGTRPGEALCCGSLPVVDVYRLSGSTISLVDRQIGP